MEYNAEILGNERDRLLAQAAIAASNELRPARGRECIRVEHDRVRVEKRDRGGEMVETRIRDALGRSSTTMTSTYLRTRSNRLARAFKQREVYRARKSMRSAKSGQSSLKRKSS